MRRIKLTQNKYAIIDNEDYEYLNQWKWYFSTPGYAQRDAGGRKNRVRIFMHRLLNKTPCGFVTDHINRNKLDNRKANLRTVKQRENCHNRNINLNNKSGYTGIYWFQNRWIAEIKVDYKKIHLGRFGDITEAIKARKQAELIYLI